MFCDLLKLNPEVREKMLTLCNTGPEELQRLKSESYRGFLSIQSEKTVI